MTSTDKSRNGSHIDVEGTIFEILEFQHVKPGDGGAFTRSKRQPTSDGNEIGNVGSVDTRSGEYVLRA